MVSKSLRALVVTAVTLSSGGPARAAECARIFTADVVAIDQPLMFNRLGAQNVNGNAYALLRDVVPVDPARALGAGNAMLRPDKRPRPLVLRVAAGDCLRVNFQNFLHPTANPNNADPAAMQIDDQVAERWAGFHVAGLQVVDGVRSDGSNVGQNGPAGNGLVPPGGSISYLLYAEKEGAFLASNAASLFGGEGSQGSSSTGLFGAVNVEPAGARFYRSQVTEEELRLATTGTNADGQPILDYARRYPATNPDGTPSVWAAEGKAGLPVLSITDPPADPGVTEATIVHSDLNAVVAGPNADGTWDRSGPGAPYPLERAGVRNPTLPNRTEAFREFTVVFHDEVVAAQAFPGFFEDDATGYAHILHGVRDAFMVNYGSGGIGSEILANRLRVGPMHDCLDCAYEEFFLTSFTVGDPAMVVDVPANAGLETLAPGQDPPAGAVGPKASRALYPSEPSNVHHAYMSDFVKFRNLHAGKEHHVFHLHNHQWLYNPNDDNSNYIDAQGVGPGSGYTYEINFGGAGNRNRSAGDAIFHCHFYPHFAQGMWEHFRIHDVLETGTALAASGCTTQDCDTFHTVPYALADGLPAPQARALPDGEILAGTPIPAVVPLPGKAMAPMPGEVRVTPNPNTTVASALHADPLVAGTVVPVGSNAVVVDRTRNPGYPFWIAGIEHTVGQRPTNPPLDMLTESRAAEIGAAGGDPALGAYKDLFAGRATELVAGAGGWNGGLPRHTLDGYAAGGEAVSHEGPLDFTKVMTRAKPVYFPETGTDVEHVAMRFHAQRNHPSTALQLGGAPVAASFVTNGLPPVPSAPYHEPCEDDLGNKILAGQPAHFFSEGYGQTNVVGTPVHGSENPRVYKGANVQIDAVFNKLGWHYPQQRIISLWDDVLPTINKARPPQPFVIRFNTFDCGKYLHTNLVPEVYELDDYQVKTPTDVIGQHIHLPKWDLTTTDGSGNGWNYEDGTLAPGAVRERIEAINHYNATAATPVATLEGELELHPLDHPYFGPGPNGIWKGARTTIQRWFFDPVVNAHRVDRGLGVIFTHDHFGPSTHQQVGLYASVITEPANSTWVHGETGVAMHTRHDGGPTGWQAIVNTGDLDGDGTNDSYREFWFQTSDFQHAYEKGVYIGAGPDGVPNGVLPDANSFRYAISPGARVQVNPVLPDLVLWSALCPSGQPRPCPEAISAADPGMFVINYRNEPVAARIYDPNKVGPDGKSGAQADGLAGDLAFALQSRSDRAIPALNSPLGDTPYPPLTSDVGNGDPFTPILRAYAGDRIRLKVQIGGQEEEHATSLHGLKWLQGGSSFGKAGNSGWRNIQPHGISEQFTFAAPVTPFVGQPGNVADYAYSANPSQDGWWTGSWGILRTYGAGRSDLAKLPSNPNPGQRVRNTRDFDGVCPRTAPTRTYEVSAALANDVLGNPLGATLVPADEDPAFHAGNAPDPAGGTLVFNPRTGAGPKPGPLHDPTAILYVFDKDLEAKDPDDPNCLKISPKTGLPKLDINLPNCPVKLKAGVPVEPIVLRAAAGDCIDVTLRNRLPADLDGNGFFDDNPDLGNYTALMTILKREDRPEGVTTFNNNHIKASSWVGLHPQLVAYDVLRADGATVGRNAQNSLASPTGIVRVRWYAGDVSYDPVTGTLTATPIEFGGSNLIPADKVKQGQKGLGGALVVHPQGSAWAEDAGRRSAASVGPDANKDGVPDSVAFRDFTLLINKSMSHRYGDGTPVENIGADVEGSVVTDDSQDAGQIAVNYGTEPLWFRFGLAPNSPFGNTPGGLGAVDDARLSFANALVGGDPSTPVFTAAAGTPVHLHVTSPHGAFRGSVFALHGHVWERDPYYCPPTATGGNDLGIPGKCTTAEVGSRRIGTNPIGFAMGGQDGVHPYAHYDLVLKAGGAFERPGDYLFRDSAGFGVTMGLWGILRAEESAP